MPAFSEPKSNWPRRPLSDQGRGAARAAGGAPRGNPTIPTHPGRRGPHPRPRSPSLYLQLRQLADEDGDPPGRHRRARCGNPNPTDRLLIAWGSRIKPTLAGDNGVPSSDHKSFHTCTTVIPRVDTAPHGVETPTPPNDC